MSAFSQNHLVSVGKLWGLHSFQLIRKMVNTIYFAKGKDEEVIVRLTPSYLRSKEEVEVELEWLQELKNRVFRLPVPFFL